MVAKRVRYKYEDDSLVKPLPPFWAKRVARGRTCHLCHKEIVAGEMSLRTEIVAYTANKVPCKHEFAFHPECGKTYVVHKMLDYTASIDNLLKVINVPIDESAVRVRSQTTW